MMIISLKNILSNYVINDKCNNNKEKFNNFNKKCEKNLKTRGRYRE